MSVCVLCVRTVVTLEPNRLCVCMGGVSLAIHFPENYRKKCYATNSFLI